MIKAWFPTQIYSAPLQRAGLERLNAGLAEECRALRDFDRANWQWSKDQSKTKKTECGGVGCANENAPGLHVAA